MRFRMSTFAIALLLCACSLAPAAELEDVYFRSTDGAFLYGALRVPDGAGPFPGLLIIHGGAGGAGIPQVRALADPGARSPTIREFAKRDWVLLSIDYRNNALFGMEEEDVVAGFRYLTTRPEVDAKRIAVWGGSHGGHLALRLAERVGSEIVGVAAGSPWATNPMAYLFGDFSQPPLSEVSEETAGKIRGMRQRVVPLLPQAAGFTAANLKSKVKERSVLENAGKIECPILLATSRGDVSVPHAMVEPLINKLNDLGAPLTTYVAETAPHGYYLNPKEHAEEHAAARRMILEFLEEHLHSE